MRMEVHVQKIFIYMSVLEHRAITFELTDRQHSLNVIYLSRFI